MLSDWAGIDQIPGDYASRRRDGDQRRHRHGDGARSTIRRSSTDLTAAVERADVAEPHRRRRAPHPARQVRDRVVRAPAPRARPRRRRSARPTTGSWHARPCSGRSSCSRTTTTSCRSTRPRRASSWPGAPPTTSGCRAAAGRSRTRVRRAMSPRARRSSTASRVPSAPATASSYDPAGRFEPCASDGQATGGRGRRSWCSPSRRTPRGPVTAPTSLCRRRTSPCWHGSARWSSALVVVLLSGRPLSWSPSSCPNGTPSWRRGFPGTEGDGVCRRAVRRGALHGTAPVHVAPMERSASPRRLLATAPDATGRSSRSASDCRSADPSPPQLACPAP